VSELVLTRNQLLQIARNEKDSGFVTPLQRLNHVVSDLQEGVMKTRMQPIGNAWAKLPRIIRDLSMELGKKIDLVMTGQDTELDRQVLDMIKDPLTHMVRNSGDHGIEPPADRIRAGKPETGTVHLRAFHEGGHIIIEIADDGRGLPLEKIKKKIIQNGLATEDEVAKMSAQQIQQYIIHAGFSTADKVTSVSGRGVGMDVVRRNVEAMSGAVTVYSRHGHGSVFRIKLPLTLAILDGLLVRVGTEVFILPLVSIAESIRPRRGELRHVGGGGEVVMVRGQALPLLRLHRMFGFEGAVEDPTQASVVILDHDNRRFALLVDDLLGQQQVVVKSLEAHFRKVAGVMGATILGDGRAALILDVAGLLSFGSNGASPV